jgi:hypothetical protein
VANRSVVNAIIQGSRRRGLDPNAVLAIARVEGLSGRVGDQGTSFGPFQLHIGGAMPRGIRNPQQWAMSQQGINYALDHIAAVARGLRGRQAVAAISSRFERPADVAGEISKAMSFYGGGGGGGGGVLSPAAASPYAAVPQRGRDLTGLFNVTRSLVGLPALTTSIYAPGPPQQKRPYTRLGAQPGGGAAPRRGGRSLNFLEHYASPYGLTVTSTTGGKHVKNSYHYRGRAVDLSGSPARMRALAQSALKHPQDFVEMFYDPIGLYIKNGKVYKGAIGGHSDHVHLAR